MSSIGPNSSNWETISVPSLNSGNDETHRVRLGVSARQAFAAEAFRPVLVLGPQRSYKTTGIAVPTVLEWQGPAVVTSVRTDVLRDTVGWRDSQGSVYIFDPAGTLAGTKYEKYCVAWDILEHSESWDDCVRMARALTEAGRVTGVNEGQFWHNLAAQTLAPLLLAAKEGGRSMADVLRWVWTQEEFEVRALLQQGGHEVALIAAENSWSRDDRTRSSVYTTLTSALRVYDYGKVRQTTGRRSLNIGALLASVSDTLFICSPPDDQEEFKALFTGLLRTILRLAYQKNLRAQDELESLTSRSAGMDVHNGTCALLLMLDEAGVIAPIEGLESIAATSAGAGIQVVSIFHDVSQIESIYGIYDARSIINNHSALVVLPGLRDLSTLDYVESLLRGERVANSTEASWLGPRPIRGLRRGEALLVYENLRPVVISLRSKFTDEEIRHRAARF